MTDTAAKTKVIILTRSYRVKGFVDLLPGSRLTDFMDEAREFIAVTEAEVMEPHLGGRQVMLAPFLNISRSSIELIAPVN